MWRWFNRLFDPIRQWQAARAKSAKRRSRRGHGPGMVSKTNGGHQSNPTRTTKPPRF